ncbi:MAG TPA: hypothetical protein VGL37_00215 [Solirubrobacteraceae bacterium]
MTVITQWMASENCIPTTSTCPYPWWNRNNPLNNGLGSGGGDGTGSYSNVVIAAYYAALNLEANDHGYPQIAADLAASDAPSVTATAIEDSDWAASHYGYGSGWHSSVVESVAAPASAWGNGGGGPPMSNGSFVRTPDGSIYVVAGGAALHVDNCAPLGGCPGVVELPNLAGYATEPSDGTFLRVADGASAGLIARVVGGVPLGLDTCEGIPECSSAVNIDSGGYSDYSAAHQTIANGTVVRVADGRENGLIGRVVGGVLLGFLTCEGIPECGSAVNVDEDAYNWYANQYHTIANGTVVRVADGPENGLIGRVVGGVLLGLATCEGIPECSSAVNVAENAYNWYANQYHTIANGTVVRVADGPENGLIGRVVGGVLLGFLTCEGIPECSSAVNVAENAYNYYAGEYHTIADGTFVRVADGPLAGLVARAAGGALIGLATCVPLEECPGFVNVAENAFAFYTAEHPEPANGTLVEGLPSDTYWIFNDGQREPASPSPGAIAIDDGGLGLYPTKALPIETVPTTPTSSANTNGAPPVNQARTQTPSHGVLSAKATKLPKGVSALSRALAKCRKIKNHRKRAKCKTAAELHHPAQKKRKR